MKLSEPQKALLTVATNKTFVSFFDALRSGGNGVTLSTLCKKGLLKKISYPDGSNDWSITDEGRAAMGMTIFSSLRAAMGGGVAPEKHNAPFYLCRYCMPRLLGGWAALCGLAALAWWVIA